MMNAYTGELSSWGFDGSMYGLGTGEANASDSAVDVTLVWLVAQCWSTVVQG
jgi:hypothetical protein